MATTKMKETSGAQLEPPRFANGKALLIAGLRQHFTPQTMDSMGGLWGRFAPHIGNVAGQVGRVAYGLCFNARGADGIDYLAGVEVSGISGLPSEFSRATIPSQRYAVFPHRGHVSKLKQTLDAVDRWLPASGLECAAAVAGAPDFFERYGERFDPQTGMGDIEVWIPIKA